MIKCLDRHLLYPPHLIFRVCLFYKVDPKKNKLTGAILVGTGNQPKSSLCVGTAFVKTLKLFYKETYRSELLNHCIFGMYNRNIKDSKSAYEKKCKFFISVDIFHHSMRNLYDSFYW